MRKIATSFVGLVLALGCTVTMAHAVQYPPPGDPNPADTLIYVRFIQDPSSIPHPASPDTVWGVGGIVTGFDTFPASFGFYIQNHAIGANSAPWTGLTTLTGAKNYKPPDGGTGWPGLGLGDSVVCYGQLAEFQGETELQGFNGAIGSDRVRVRRVSTGNTLPPFHSGTVNELREPSSNPNGERWEGCLVMVNGPMRVVRTSLQNSIGTANSFLVVDNVACPNGSVGPCDSLFIDGNTLANPAYTPLLISQTVDLVQGIYNQRTRGYRIQLRDANDIVPATPPNVTDAYPVADDTIRVVFDRPVTQASVENIANYSLASFGTVVSATRVEPSAVHLKITNGLQDGDNEAVTVVAIAGQANGMLMQTPQTRNFINGVLPISLIQAPDPAALGGAPCVDRSRFAGTGSAVGTRLTFRGLLVSTFGSINYMTDALPGQKAQARTGLGLFASIGLLTEAHQYLVVGGVQEFLEETQGTNNVYLRDEGLHTDRIPLPQDALISTICALEDMTCDVNQNITNGEDYEGVLVKLVGVKVAPFSTPPSDPSAGGAFLVTSGATGPSALCDTIKVDNDSGYGFDADVGHTVDVAGVLSVRFGRFHVVPRGDGDIHDYGVAGVPQIAPEELSFAVGPNPAHTPRVTFTLPAAANVELDIYDISGRLVTLLAKEHLAAGTYDRRWNGRDARGRSARSGMYFYRLKAGDKILTTRGVRLD